VRGRDAGRNREDFRPQMTLFRNFLVNHAKEVTGLAESLVRRTEVRLRAIPPIFVNLRKIAHFWIGNLPMPLIEARMRTRTFSLNLKIPMGRVPRDVDCEGVYETKLSES
jgi:hypothetical protein